MTNFAAFTTNKLDALRRFSRPHTIIGTSLSVFALFAIAHAADLTNLLNLQATDALGLTNLTIISNLLWAWFACLCGNVYIVGLNQILDIEIDKINKPHLPLAAGDFSPPQAKAIVAITGIMAVAIALMQGWFLTLTVIISLLIGTVYSLPPIRLKRFPFWASLCIFTVRGVIVNLGLFLHFQQLKLGLSLGESWRIPLSIWLLTAFILIFTYVIAIFKDMPDIEGDAKFNIMTLSISLGQSVVFNLSRQILLWLYLAFAVVGLLPFFTKIEIGVSPIAMLVAHSLLGALMWWRSRQVRLGDRPSIASFYQFIWKLFYLEYIVFPIACMLAYL
ncbi:homogentisate phytyltransferase [Thalassoporum mexicanum PCC 7367]|uniref:homogentisate phytyltransferase n=1 Tax=Thalassoporum mexicanum TaxID=3457544 RepID=UPI00029FBF0E|nr:homogentisate phytyltransferase [Pseudanabaena sp. PCC 7367]AFY69417.1 homogentisate phytyltransferase [Pseudanabaena sp. PCC 7367]